MNSYKKGTEKPRYNGVFSLIFCLKSEINWDYDQEHQYVTWSFYHARGYYNRNKER
jgi:hypothetical protein